MQQRSLSIVGTVNDSVNAGIINAVAVANINNKILEKKAIWVGQYEMDNPIKYSDGLKCPRVHYSTLGVSAQDDSNEVMRDHIMVATPNILVGLANKANREQ